MKNLIAIAFRTLAVFVILSVAVFLIPYYWLAVASVGAGFFMLKTSDDQPTAWGMLLGGLIFGAVFYLRANFLGGN